MNTKFNNFDKILLSIIRESQPNIQTFKVNVEIIRKLPNTSTFNEQCCPITIVFRRDWWLNISHLFYYPYHVTYTTLNHR